jgi:hydrogenase-4 component B
MLAPMAVLAGLCVMIGVGAPLVAPVLDRAVAAWAVAGAPASPSLDQLAPFASVSLAGVALLVALAALGSWLVARARRTPAAVGTWDCGYAAPTARMQYTSSSFAQMIVRMFGWALRPDVQSPKVDAIFPTAASFHSHVPDTVLDRGIRPLAGLLARAFGWARPMQRGSIHLYLLYILGALLALLVWR